MLSLVTLGAGVVWWTLSSLAVLSDVRDRRVPNWIAGGLLCAGLIASALGATEAHDLWRAGLAAALGLVLWLPFWWRGWLGGGDVKYFASAAAWVAPPQVWRVALLAGVLGGLCAVVMLLPRWSARETSVPSRSRPRAPLPTVPYAVPMALAFALARVVPSMLSQTLP